MTLVRDLQQAATALNKNEYEQALTLLVPQLKSHPDIGDVWQLVALAYKGVGDFAAAESAFLRAIALGAPAHVVSNLGNLYRQMGNAQAALSRYEEALSQAPEHLPTLVNRGRALLDLGDWSAARSAFEHVLSRQADHVNARIGLAQALQGEGYHEQALSLFQSVLGQQPDNAAALNGEGLSLKVLGFPVDAVASLSKAAQLQPSSADVQVNLASALAGTDRQDEAVAAYQRAIELAPERAEIHEWYNGYLGVLEHDDYLNSYREQLEKRPGDSCFAAPLARKLLLNGHAAQALEVLQTALAHNGDDPALLVELSHVSREQGLFEAAVDSAERALKLAPKASWVRQELANALLAAGDDYERAHALLGALVQEYPHDQGMWALFASALRFAGRQDEYRELVDYQRFVQQRRIIPPEDQPNLDAFMQEIKTALKALHTTRRHPVEQSMVNGTQTLDDLFSRRHITVQRLQAALGAQLVDVIAQLPSRPDHPLLSRNRGALVFSDSWSVWLRRNGFHKNHFHSEGWLSSAFYVSVPDAVNHGSGEGWIKFGEPGFRCREPLSAEYWVRPQAGCLVVFPSYLWHGTEPLQSAQERITVGYDVLPG